MEQGTVKWYNVSKGYGFIVREQGADVFLHHSHIVGGENPPLKEGDHVTFNVMEGPKGLQATDITRVP